MVENVRKPRDVAQRSHPAFRVYRDEDAGGRVAYPRGAQASEGLGMDWMAEGIRAASSYWDRFPWPILILGSQLLGSHICNLIHLNVHGESARILSCIVLLAGVLCSIFSPTVIDLTEKILSICGNAVTVVLAVFAVVGFFKNKDKISILFRYLQLSFVSERVKRLNETLGKLETVNYDNKEDRPEIFALMGQLLGQIKALEGMHPSIGQVQDELEQVISKKTRLNEAIKRKITYSIHNAIDQSMHNRIENLPNTNHEH
jgi:hypothetical protein